jgi:hypothetical protein
MLEGLQAILAPLSVVRSVAVGTVTLHIRPASAQDALAAEMAAAALPDNTERGALRTAMVLLTWLCDDAGNRYGPPDAEHAKALLSMLPFQTLETLLDIVVAERESTEREVAKN